MMRSPTEKPAKQTKTQQREATIARLIEIACEVFTRDGYANAATEEIVERAGVTRGALYHHFGSKEGLFRAVLEHLQARVGERVEQATAAHDRLWDQLVAGSTAFLEVSLHPQIQQVMLIDAPAVLGWAVWRELDEQHSMKSLREVLERLIYEGEIAPIPLEALTHLLSGAMNEAALWIAQSAEPHTALAEASQTLKRLLEGLHRQQA